MTKMLERWTGTILWKDGTAQFRPTRVRRELRAKTNFDGCEMTGTLVSGVAPPSSRGAACQI